MKKWTKWTVTLVTNEYREIEVEANDYDSAIAIAIEAGIEDMKVTDTDADWYANCKEMVE
jgi:hypothetical protein